jgi:hypothetical protein
MVHWRRAAKSTKPVIAFQISANTRTGGLGDARRVLVTAAAFAEGNGAQTKAEAMAQRLRELMTPALLIAAGVSGWVDPASYAEREGDAVDEAGAPVDLVRHDIDFVIRATAPV